jgi:hypothetical protein
MNLSATDGLMALTSTNLRNNAAGWGLQLQAAIQDNNTKIDSMH